MSPSEQDARQQIDTLLEKAGWPSNNEGAHQCAPTDTPIAADMHIANSDKPVVFYNLDVIISAMTVSTSGAVMDANYV